MKILGKLVWQASYLCRISTKSLRSNKVLNSVHATRNTRNREFTSSVGVDIFFEVDCIHQKGSKNACVKDDMAIYVLLFSILDDATSPQTHFIVGIKSHSKVCH